MNHKDYHPINFNKHKQDIIKMEISIYLVIFEKRVKLGDFLGAENEMGNFWEQKLMIKKQ